MRLIAWKSFSDYECDVGVFTMQAYEHHNKQTKWFIKNSTNNKGNICMQMIQELFQLFKFSLDW